MANKKYRKRFKRQLQKRFKQMSAIEVQVSEVPVNEVIYNSWLDPVAEDLTLVPKEVPPANLFKGKYRDSNKQYQALLDAIYNGTVEPVERYTSLSGTIIHHCNSCNVTFYSRPAWILNGKQPHECYPTKKTKSISSDNDKMEMVALFNQGFSKSKIATIFNISRSTVIKYLKQAEFR